MGFVDVPVGGFEVEVAAEEGVEFGAGGIGHFVVGGSGAVVPFVVFAGTGEGGEGGVNVGLGLLGRVCGEGGVRGGG